MREPETMVLPFKQKVFGEEKLVAGPTGFELGVQLRIAVVCYLKQYG